MVYRNENRRRGASTMEKIFINVSILCGTAIVVAITAKVIISLF